MDDAMTLICASLGARNVEALSKAARAARDAGADIVELRLDHLGHCRAREIRELRKGIDFIPIIATLRPQREGGSFRGTEAQRLGLLREAIECRYDYVDLELGIEKKLLAGLLARCRGRGVGSIVSFHDNERTPDAERIARQIEDCAAAGDIGKVALACRSYHDTVRIIKATNSARSKKLRFIAIGMGERGVLTRTLSPFLGSEIAYAGLRHRLRTADGQPEIGELRRLWGADGAGGGVTPSTGLYGLLGFPLGHSLSPRMHNTAFRALGMDAAYLPFEAGPGSLKGTLEALKAAGLRGANVTIPHKERIMRLLDGLDDTARRVGAVNTILNRNGRLIGRNTDVSGFVGALEAAGVRLEGAGALVLGAGGAARAAVYGLLKNGARVTVANRDRRRALGLARHFGSQGHGHDIDDIDIRVVGFGDAGKAMAHADILVNCTPVGMRSFAPGSPVPVGLIRRDMAVLDMVYNPLRTRLLAGAVRKGATTVSGLEMFIRQGMESFRLWTGKTFPEKAVREALAHSQFQ